MREAGFHWISAHRTSTGKVRSVNEDACLDWPEHGIWVVADGMGGHTAGDLASRMIVDTLKGMAATESLGQLVGEVKTNLQQVNQRLITEGQRRGGKIIGSTIVALLAKGPACAYLWAGDSRIYLYRRGTLRQLSRDHSQIEELIEQGLISSAEAENNPIANLITRAVGADDGLELDTEIFEPMHQDLFLLCSDGLNKEISDEEIAGLLGRYRLNQAIDELMTLALDRGARDNVTIVLVQVLSSASPAGTRPPK